MGRTGKLIYEKTYPKDDLLLLSELALETSHIPETQTIDELLENINKNTIHVFLPERQESAKQFMLTAIQLSRDYELDIKIMEYSAHISVSYCFNAGGNMGFLKHVIQYADNIAFFHKIDGYDITLSIDHYTHAVIRNGRQVMPPPIY